MLDDKIVEAVSGTDKVVGQLRVMLLADDGQIIRIWERSNMVLYGWADIATQLFAGNVAYRVGTMYFEYENLADPADPVIVPTFDRSGGVSYYNGLTGTKDYLRIPITVSPTILSSDDVKYDGNQITFYAVTQGTVGVHGLAFSNAINSAVYGYGLVTSPEADDHSQDIVMSRTYQDKVLKPLNAQIGAQWTIRFG